MKKKNLLNRIADRVTGLFQKSAKPLTPAEQKEIEKKTLEDIEKRFPMAEVMADQQKKTQKEIEAETSKHYLQAAAHAFDATINQMEAKGLSSMPTKKKEEDLEIFSILDDLMKATEPRKQRPNPKADRSFTDEDLLKIAQGDQETLKELRALEKKAQLAKAEVREEKQPQPSKITTKQAKPEVSINTETGNVKKKIARFEELGSSSFAGKEKQKRQKTLGKKGGAQIG
jgi:hypothetical protein